MLGKLIKNDLKFGARSVSNIYLAAFIAVAAMGISLLADMNRLKVLAAAALLIATFIAVIITIVSIIGNFNKTMYGSQGYLTHSLPVKTAQLVFSKWLSSSFWVFTSFILFYGAIACVYFYVTGKEGAEVVKIFFESLGEFGLPSEYVITWSAVILAVRAVLNIGIFAVIVLFGVTLSNIRPFHILGNAGSIIYTAFLYFIINYSGKGLSSLANMSVTVADSGISFAYTDAAIEAVKVAGGFAFGLTELYFSTVVSIVLFVVIIELVEKKINLK